MSFERWMEEVNRLCLSTFGLSIHDLPDMCFRDAFDCNVSPEEFMQEELGNLSQLADKIIS